MTILDKRKIRYYQCRILSKYKILCVAKLIDFHCVKLQMYEFTEPFCKYIEITEL